MLVPQSNEVRRGGDAEGLSRVLTELPANQNGSVVREADEPAIEGCIPQRREQEPVVHVEPLYIACRQYGTAREITVR